MSLMGFCVFRVCCKYMFVDLVGFLNYRENNGGLFNLFKGKSKNELRKMF